MAVASAKATCGPSRSAVNQTSKPTPVNAMLANIAITPIRTGVRVSWWAKNPGANTLTRMNAGRPSANAVSASPAMRVSNIENSRYCNSVARIGSARSAKPTADGNATASPTRTPHSSPA